VSKFTKTRFQKLAGLLKEGDVVDLADYREKKEREKYRHSVLVSADGQILSDPGEWYYVVLDHEDQEDALIDGDVVKAEELGAKFYDLAAGAEESTPSEA